MENKIWYELVDVKFGECYLTKYIGLQKSLRKTSNICTLLLSVSGILGWKFFENYAWIAFVLIAIMQLFNLIENQIIRSDNEIESLATLRLMYTRYFNKLEELWTQYSYDRITVDEVMEKYFQLRKDDWEKIEELDCKLNIRQYKRLEKKAEVDTLNYLNKHHYHE